MRGFFTVILAAILGGAALAQSAPLPIPQYSTLPQEEELQMVAQDYFARCAFNANPLAGRRFALYQVALNGQSFEGPFQRLGELLLVESLTAFGTTNGVNGNDLILVSGQPSVSPEAGAIRFATNSGLFSLLDARCTESLIDFAFVGTDLATGQLFVQPDVNIAAAGLLNSFNQRTGLVADIYLIKDGLIQLQFQQGGLTIVGLIQLQGTGYLYGSNTPYVADLSGSILGTGVF